MNEEQLRILEELLKKVQQQAKQLGLESPFTEEQIKNANSYEEALNSLSQQFKSFSDLLDAINNDLGGIVVSITRTIEDLGKSNEGVNRIFRNLRSIRDIGQKIASEQAGDLQLTSKELETLSKRFSESFSILTQEAESGGIENRISEQKAFVESLTTGTKEYTKQQEKLQELIDLQGFLNQETGKGREFQESLLGIIEKSLSLRKEEEKTLRKQAGLTGAIVTSSKELLQTIGLGAVVDFIDFESIESQIREKTKELTDKASDGEIGFSGRLKVLGTGLSAVKKQAIEALKDPAAGFIFLLSQGIKLLKNLGKVLVDTFKAVDTEAGQLAKTFNLTYQEAVGIREELVAAAQASNELFVTSKALQETLGALNAAVGTRTFSGLSNELQQSVVFLTKLREESAVTSEQLQVLAELTFATGQNTEDITANLLGAVEVFAARQGLIINEKDLFKQIEQFSKATLLTLSQTPYRIGEAVAEARSLGTTLSQVEAISGTIVNFQSSIQDELAAQVLTGRALNLNAARLAALNNDTATVAKEIREQIGGAAEFGRLNRIQQEAFARAIGFGRDEMAQMLLVQEQIAGLQGEEAERRQKAVELLIKQRGIDGAITQAGQAQIQRLEKQVSVQEQFTASVNKLKEIFVDIAAIVGPLFSGIAAFVGKIASVISSVQGSGEILGGAGLGAAIGTLVAPGIGTAIGGTIGALGGLATYAADDAYFPPMEGEGYDRALLTPEGTFKLNNDDNIIAGTDNSIRPRIPRTGYTTQTDNSIRPRIPRTGYTTQITPITNVSNTTTQPISSQNVTNLTSTEAVDMSELVSTMKKSNELIEQQTKTLAEGQNAIRMQKQNLVVGATNLGTQLNTYSYRVQYG